VKGMAVFDAPPLPGCWPGGELIRIVDPLGVQVAWVAPALAGGIVGYYVREAIGDDWTEVLACSVKAGRAAGSALLLRDEDTGHLLPVLDADPAWTFASRDPTQVTVTGRIANHDLSLTVRCADGALQIEVEAGEGHHLPAIGLRLVVGSTAGQVVTETSRGGELEVHGGALRHLTLVYPPRLECHVRTSGGGDNQVDLVPTRNVLDGGSAATVSIALIPQPARPAVTA
jgi:hypothetical protein